MLQNVQIITLVSPLYSGLHKLSFLVGNPDQRVGPLSYASMSAIDLETLHRHGEMSCATSCIQEGCVQIRTPQSLLAALCRVPTPEVPTVSTLAVFLSAQHRYLIISRVNVRNAFSLVKEKIFKI